MNCLRKTLCVSVLMMLLVISSAKSQDSLLVTRLVESTRDTIQPERAIDSAAALEAGKIHMDSLLVNHPMVKKEQVVYAISDNRTFVDRTVDFYLLVSLILLLGLIRFIDPRYFHILWQAFHNPGLSNRSLTDKLQHASFPNFLMNVFFAVSAAAYLFYLVKNITPQRAGNLSPSLLILMLIAGMMAIYSGKYVAIKFSGWAFRVEGITEQYLFNVFLINKVLSVALLPFIVLIAFADEVIAEPAIIVSLLLILILFINRYLRSWQVFGSFFQYSKFHFFTYLCASELLPLAVLMKLLVRGLLY